MSHLLVKDPRAQLQATFSLRGCRRRKRRRAQHDPRPDEIEPSSDPRNPFRKPILKLDDDHDNEAQIEGLAHRFLFPPHAAKNPFIYRGFKAPADWTHALNTLFYCDNETANVYSSLWGVIPIGFLATNVLWADHPNFDPTGLFIAMGLFLGNIVLTSAYHLFNQVPHLYTIWTTLDFAGINMAICSLSFAMSWYGHGLWPQSTWYYEFVLVLGLAVLVTLISSMYMLTTDHDTFFLQPLNIAALFFVLRTFFLRMPATARNTCFLSFMSIGALIHVAKIPERWYPGQFCFVGHSHMIWHCSYTIAFYCFYSSIAHENMGSHALWDEPLFNFIERTLPFSPYSSLVHNGS